MHYKSVKEYKIIGDERSEWCTWLHSDLWPPIECKLRSVDVMPAPTKVISEGLRYIFYQDLVKISRIFNRTSYYHVTRNLKWDNSWEIITFGSMPRQQVIFNSLFLWWLVNSRLFKNLFHQEMLVSYWLIGQRGDNRYHEYSGSDQD